jgi:transcription elongation factor GreA
MKRNPITPEGYRSLVAELTHLKTVVRGQIVKDIEEARAHGDLSENSEYDDAKERQSLCEGRINNLDNRMSSADIIDVAKLPVTDRVVFGTTVDLEDPKSGDLKTWRIVGEIEADVAKGTISYSSPLGRSLIGNHEGDEVRVPAPGGLRIWEIVKVT